MNVAAPSDSFSVFIVDFENAGILSLARLLETLVGSVFYIVTAIGCTGSLRDLIVRIIFWKKVGACFGFFDLVVLEI